MAELDPDTALDDSFEEPGPDSTIGRIALKQVRVSRADVSRSDGGRVDRVEMPRGAEEPRRDSEPKKPGSSPLNRLVPYLDLFGRLSDEELSRLARTPASVVETLRQQVDEVNRVLSRFTDLLPRLTDEELVRLTAATPKTIRFWRLCQPRVPGVPVPVVRENSDVRPLSQVMDASGSSDQMQIREIADPPSGVVPSESGTMVVDHS